MAFSKKTSYPTFPTKHTLAMLMYLFVYEVAGSDQQNNVGKITTTVNSVSQKKRGVKAVRRRFILGIQNKYLVL